MNFKDPALLLQEIPLHSNYSQRPAHEISVAEGGDPIEGNENVTFPESGGGVTLQLNDSTRVISWRTHSNVLELFEYSLDVNLFSSHFVITFEESKILPDVHISLVKNQLHIVCCTILAVHNIILDIPTTGRQGPKPGVPYPSLLSNITSFDFENENHNCYYGDQAQGQVTNFTAQIAISNDREGPSVAAALKTSQGNMILIKMMARTAPVIVMINQASRMSRLLSGINPWAEAGGTETIADFKIITVEQQLFIVAACVDHKLRIWSYDTHDLVSNYDFSNQISDDADKTKTVDMKIRTAGDDDVISVYASIADNASFAQFKMNLIENSNTLNVDFFSLVSAPLVQEGMPRKHLVDFTLSNNNQITALWRDIEEIDSMSVCAADAGVWHDVAVYPAPIVEIHLLPYQDVREVYMDYIFTPGRFSPLALARTLSVQRRSMSSSMATMDLQELKERVAAHMQTEIQEISPEEGVDDDALQVNVWNAFYQTLVQYQQVVSRSLGLTISQKSSHSQPLVSVIKKGYLSVLTPVSLLEAVCRGADPQVFNHILQPNEDGYNSLNDLAKLLKCLGNLHGYLGGELLDSIQQNLCLSGNSPQDVIEDIIDDILDSIREATGNETLENFVSGMEDMTSAVKLLLRCLEPIDFEVDFDIPDVQSWPSGSHGIELLSRCTVRHIENRFQLSILLYIISHLLESPSREGPHMHHELPTRVVSYVQTYQAMLWLSTVWSQNISQATLESTMQTLSVHDASVTGIGPERRSMSPQGHKTILEFFISVEGGKLLQVVLKEPSQNLLVLNGGTISKAVKFITYLMWPLGPTLALPDFLLSHGHYSILQRYIQHELGNWCNWSTKSRAYMLAHCHLHHGNFDKAVQSFISAASGITTEDYLMNKLLKEDEDDLHPVSREIIYYTKVLPIFERLDLPEQVIVLAEHAMQVTKNHGHDPNIPILLSSVFRQSNYLSRHHEALEAIVMNPDPDHRKDCLRTLAVSLCERKKYKTLVEFQYGELEEDLINILEHRARGTDLATASHNYYDLLYAFHIQRGNFRKAASAMYEQGYRIGCEFTPSTSVGNMACLQKQLGCYAACINCLHLVAADNRWILHPVGNRAMSAPSQQPAGYRSPKRQNDGEFVDHPQRKVIIHEISDIQKEALLVEMKLKLEEVTVESMQTVTSPLVSAVEIVSFLCHTGLYDDAIIICKKFDLPLNSIFSSLASKCVRLSYADDKAMSEGWDWLQENETVKTHCGGGKSSTVKWTAADASYRLLQIYLERHGYTPSRGTQYYYAIAKSLLGLSATLPAWFANDYKSRNSPELLRLLICFDRIEEATSLALELIETAKIKIGTDFDEIRGYRRGTWLPYTVIEQLLYILEDMRTKQEFDELYYMLNEALEEYQHIAETTSSDMIQAQLQRAAVVAMQS